MNKMNQPLVSIIIRTCQRPHVLERALNSVRKQTYKNIQVVIVEDGENKSERYIREKFPDLNMLYYATGKKCGRSHAGNVALKLSEGELLNFLDDDDMLFPKHIEALVNALTESSNMAAYSIAEERQIIENSKKPDEYKVKRKMIRYKQPFNRLLLYTFNYIPIQSIMFQKSLYEEYGGFDEKLDNLEDWDLWVRYSQKTEFTFVNELTSCYHVPYANRARRNRSNGLRDYITPVIHNFESYHIDLDVRTVHDGMNYVIREYKNNGIVRYMRMFFRAILFGEK